MTGRGNNPEMTTPSKPPRRRSMREKLAALKAAATTPQELLAIDKLETRLATRERISRMRERTRVSRDV